jgi:hypothetical protein
VIGQRDGAATNDAQPPDAADRWQRRLIGTLSFYLTDFLGVLAVRLLFWFSFMSFVSFVSQLFLAPWR